MKIKNFLIESAYFLGMLIATWLTVSSCAAHAQIRPSTPYNAKQRLVYIRGDTVFERSSNGVEEPLLPSSVYQYHIDSLEAELFLYKPKPGIIVIELDTTSNKMVYRKKIGYVKITNLYDDSLWVTDSIFVTAGVLNPVNGLRVGESAKAWQWDAAKWENVIVTPPPIRGDSLFIDDSTFVLLQGLNKQKFGWVTDSIKWVSTDTTFKGEPDCGHDWVYHPPGQHCNLYSDVREKICRHCLHGETEREQWYQRFVAPPKSEFELLKEKQRANR